MQCPHCFKEDLDERATRCPHCGGEVLPPQATDKKEQSGFGRASCVVAVVANIGTFLRLFLGSSENSGDGMMVVGVMLSLAFVLAFVLGVIGLCQTSRKKLLSLLGIALSVWPWVLLLVLILIAKLFGVHLN